MKTIYKYVCIHTEFGKLFNFSHLSWEVHQHACYVHVCISKHMVNKGGQCANHICTSSKHMVNNQQGWMVGWMLLMEDNVGARLSEYA